jgi:sugar (pentulose or hexulose) kinase
MVGALVFPACSASSSESADAAVAAACEKLGTNTRCPVAPGGACLATGECNAAAVPSGVACTGSETCTTLVDPCPPLSNDSPTSAYGCACVGGRWACDDCAPSGAECADAGADDAK